jgi:hypothetical protein
METNENKVEKQIEKFSRIFYGGTSALDYLSIQRGLRQ